MLPKLRGFFQACLVFVGSFVGVFALQMLRAPSGWDEPRNWPAVIPVETGSAAKTPAVTPTPGTGAATVPPAAKPGYSPTVEHGDAVAGVPNLDAASVAPVTPPDPAARIRGLSDTALYAQSRLERIVAINTLGSLADKGDESGEIETALLYTMSSQDPVVASKARELYGRIGAAK